MVHYQTIERQLLRRQRRAEVGIALLIASQYFRLELCRPRPVRWLPAALMHQTAIALFAITPIQSPQMAIVQTAECGRFLLLQLAALHSEKDLQSLALFRAHHKKSLHLPTLSGVRS